MRTTAPAQHNATQASGIVVAGAAGMLGSHLCEALVATGSKVIGLDDLAIGTEKNLQNLRGNELFELIETNIADKLPAALYKQNISHVIHVAHAISHLGRQDLELSQLLANSHGLKNLLDLAQKKEARLLYASSMDIYRGLASHRNLEHYYDGLEVSAYYSFIEAKRYGEALAKEYWDNYGLDVRIARLGQVYGPRMALNETSTLARLLHLALAEKDLIVDEDGSREHILIYITDAVYGLTKLLFSDREDARGGIFYLVNPERVSTLSIAYTLRELVNPKLVVEFVPQQQGFKLPDPPKVDISRSEELLFWQPRVDLTEGLEKTLRWFSQKTTPPNRTTPKLKQPPPTPASRQKESRPTRLSKKKPKKLPPHGWLWVARQAKNKAPKLIKGIQAYPAQLRWHKQRKLAFSLLVGVSLLVLPLLTTFTFVRLAIRNLHARNFEAAKTNFLRAEQTWHLTKPLYFLTRQMPEHQATQQALLAAYFGADAVMQLNPLPPHLGTALNKLWQSWQDVPTDQPVPPKAPVTLEQLEADLETLSRQTPAAIASLQLMHTQLKQLDPNQLPKVWGLADQVGLARSLLNSLAPSLESVNQLLAILPTLLGYNQPQQYLVLLQNNTELRPTGGFVGSYIVFQLQDGQLTRFKVDDIYNPDGRLEELPADERIPAPKPIRDYLQINYLGARDANWWPDFPQSADKIIQLYQQATTEPIQTVIGVNLNLLEQVLSAIGPVYVPEYKQEITAQNIFEQAEFHAEVGFKPGSPQKKNFLAALTEALLEKLPHGLNPKQQLALLDSLAKDLRQKNLLFYSQKASVEQWFRQNNWSGSLEPGPGDYLYIVDANVGGNKANFWVTRKTNYFVDLDREGNLAGNLAITWQHRSTSTTWPSGDYQNYLRIYLPNGSKLLESEGFVDQTLQTTCQSQPNYCLISGLVKIPINTTQTIRLRYKLPTKLSLAERPHYQLRIQKQAGIQSEQFTFRLNLPSFLSSTSPTEYNLNLDHDYDLTILVSGNDKLKKGLD